MNKYLVRSNGDDIFLIKYIRPSTANSEWAGSSFNRDDFQSIGAGMADILYVRESSFKAAFGTHARSLKRAVELSRKFLKYNE